MAHLGIDALTPHDARRVVGIFCDIDDTLTWEGRLVPAAFAALSDAQEAGLKVVPITGRPAGWVDQIARLWPVDGVVGENGGLWFAMDDTGLQRHFLQSEATRTANRAKLDALAASILRAVPGTALASDQAYRALDLAIDFCEDVPALGDDAIDAIVGAFDAAGATCKVSSIHVNGWYGTFDKLTGCEALLNGLWSTSLDDAAGTWLFVGDSANDEPLFEHFDLSVGVSNVERFLPRLTHTPRFITERPGGHGFADVVQRLLALR